MIKLGDYIKLKEDVAAGTRKQINSLVKFPLKVEIIDKCTGAGISGCEECPGYINKQHYCFGYNHRYAVEPIREWDE